ncbi:peptide deformylase [Citroniella saccharovorans]|uniref:Peptide deformylase n=1 Tax=Citroniella saccharovorans TaxID=2053367 RepID=A0AAW9MZM4_9FIRM|nr:peptide deformylase [Citroniella saccharovorans]MEB3429507.1 peptide deformylase [Citroniella saccharovorans]
MALREIRIEGDEILGKVSKEVLTVTPRIKQLILDMFETMDANDGIGLAAVQVGTLRRIIVINIEQEDKKTRMALINPNIIEESGKELGLEGCLSIPNFRGKVYRPTKLKVSYRDENFEEKVLEAEGLMARCLCHEIDHLNGILFDQITVEEDDTTD